MRGKWQHLGWLTPGLLLVLLATGPAGSGTTAPIPDLAGHWQLNTELSQDPRTAMREAMEKARAERGGDLADDLQITSEGPQLTLSAGEGRQRVLYTDGRKASEERPGGTVKTRAQWKEGALEVVTQDAKGRQRTEIFEITHDRKRLYVLVSLEGDGRRPAVTFRRVYDPVAEPAEPAPAPPPGADDDEEDEAIADGI